MLKMFNNKTTTITLLLIICILLLLFNDTFYINYDDKLKIVDKSIFNSLLNQPSINDESTECKLPNLDPWDAVIIPYLRPNKNNYKTCEPQIEMMTDLDKNGKLSMTNITIHMTDVTCQYRCLYPKSDYRLSYSGWSSLTESVYPECDFIETTCRYFDGNEHFYSYLHKQCYRPKVPESTEEDNPEAYKVENVVKPDFHIILFDSVSQSQFIRSMPKTRYILEDVYQGVPYRFLNKIGLNSRPNGFALLFGKTIYKIKKSPISPEYKSDFNNSMDYCSKPLDDDQFIGFRFQDDDYATLMSEDWSLGVFNWPNCKGFISKPTTHYMRPFQLKTDSYRYKSPALARNLHRRSCKEQFHHQIEYLRSFIDTYPDKPKFSLTWMSYLAHNDINALYHVDDYFYKFFKEYQQKFNNSYLFVMGDHGNRFNGYRKYDIGEMEDNNPFLFVILPENLRKSDIMHQLRNNSAELITHYDLYATMVSITNPRSPRIKDLLLKGSSILKALPKPRTCGSLFIPFDYCLCQKQEISLPLNSQIAINGAKTMINEMNSNLKGDPETKDSCHLLELNNSSDVFITEIIQKKSSKSRIYKIQFITVPGNGSFWGFISENKKTGELQILSEKMPRMDSYADQANCAIQAKYASYCYCNNLNNVEMT